MSDFKGVKEVTEYLQKQGWRAKDRETNICSRTIYGHIKLGYLKREKGGSFSKSDVDQYAQRYLDHQTAQTAKSDVQEAIDRERLRKLKLENDTKSGQLVSLSEEIKRRVSVIQGFKSALINGKATFKRSLQDSMKKRHPESQVLNDLLLDAADLYEDAVLDVFHEIFSRGKV
jgi:hypothetical protein